MKDKTPFSFFEPLLADMQNYSLAYFGGGHLRRLYNGHMFSALARKWHAPD